MTLFERAEIRALSERLLGLAEGQGIPLTSRAGRELDEFLTDIGGMRPVGRGANRQLTERGRDFLTTRLRETHTEDWSGETVLASLGGHLPSAINGATLSGLWLRDCKAALSQAHLARADELGIRVWGDELIRLRCEGALSLRWQNGRRYCGDESMTMLGELALPERSLAGLQEIEWQGAQIVTVENKGAFVDLPLLPGILLIYVPGRNTRLAKQVLPRLPSAVPWAHAGDLDQRGLDIATELARAISRPPALWLPTQVTDYVRHYGKPLTRRLPGEQGGRGKIPWRHNPVASWSDARLAEVFTHLAVDKLWVEQEVMVTAGAWQSWPLDEMPA